MELQEIYDKVKAHLLSQGKPAMDVDGRCSVYRAEDGTKCAVGCLIPDELYRPEFEGMTVATARAIWVQKGEETPLMAALLPLGVKDLKNFQLLEKLQFIHDAYLPERWPAKLQIVAELFGLKP